MFKTQVEWRVVLLPSFVHFMISIMVNNSTDHRKLPSMLFFFYNDMEKVWVELALFPIEKAHGLHLTSFILSVLL